MFTQKLLSLFLSPLTQSILLYIFAIFFIIARRIRLSVFFLLSGVFWLCLWSLTITADYIQYQLESDYTITSIQTLPFADAIIVLGGSIKSASIPNVYPDLSSAADRPVHAARLFHAGKAPLILVSAGSLPWNKPLESEAVATSKFLMDMGVPKDSIFTESGSDSTYANAVNSYAILENKGYTKILLVTSAWHMKRAKAVFEHVGFEVIPAPTDYESIRGRSYTLLDWLPSTTALERSVRSIKEMVGYWVYRYRGWIN